MADELVMRHSETSACNKSENYLNPHLNTPASLQTDQNLEIPGVIM
jgi:hypothetical protein